MARGHETEASHGDTHGREYRERWPTERRQKRMRSVNGPRWLGPREVEWTDPDLDETLPALEVVGHVSLLDLKDLLEVGALPLSRRMKEEQRSAVRTLIFSTGVMIRRWTDRVVLGALEGGVLVGNRLHVVANV